MPDTIAVAGVIGNDPERGVTNTGKQYVNFRLASNRRRFNKTTESWEDDGTNWYAVAAYGNLARNLGHSVSKGAHVIVTGRLEVREWKSGDKFGRDVQLIADSAGHDLTWGTTVFTRTAMTSARPVGPDAGSFEPAESSVAPALVSG